MSQVHVYLKPYIDDAGSGYVADWVDVTADIADLGTLTEALDNTDYDVGVFRASSMKLSLRNDHGHYSDVQEVYTIFKFKRSNSLVRITWEPGDGPLVAGFFQAGAPTSIVSEEIVIFTGLLSDLATQSHIDDLNVDFQILGYESVLDQMVVPYASINNGDTIASAIYTCLNQTPFNSLVTVNVSNITTAASTTLDDKTNLKNLTVLDAVKDFLAASNSVFYIRNGIVFTAPRTPGASLAYTFYGPGSPNGIESTQDIEAYRTGVNRIFNYWTWANTTFVVKDDASIATYGVQQKDVSFGMITDTGKQTTLLTSLKTEFAVKKREFMVDTPINPDRLALYLLDQIAVDYPTVAIPNENENVAFYGRGVYGTDYYPDNLFILTIDATARFKIMGRKIDFKKEIIGFAMREV